MTLVKQLCKSHEFSKDKYMYEFYYWCLKNHKPINIDQNK